MARLYSNELKAVVYADNVLDNPVGVLRDHCITVQHFDYSCVLKRNDSHRVYGSSEGVTLNFTIRINAPEQARVFYRRLLESGHYMFSFLFNATYNAFDRLSDYDDGMVVDGYVVHLEEKYKTGKTDDGASDQMLLEVKLLLRSITYLGVENHLENSIIK